MKDHNIVALANVVRDAGGVLVAPRMMDRVKFRQEANALATYAPGCGLPTHVAGTNGGTMPCGAVLTQLGVTGPYYCAECTKKGLLSPHDPQSNGRPMKPITEQIETALNIYVAGIHDPRSSSYDATASVMTDLRIKTAMLSGMSLTAHFLSSNDGHPEITPQAIEQACQEVGEHLGLQCAPLLCPPKRDGK